MAHLSSIVDSDASSEFEGFTSADISEANRKWNKTNSYVDNDSISDSDAEPESEIFSGSSGQGNYSTSSSDDNYSISSESSPLDDIENNYPLDEGSTELDIDDIVDTDNILQNDGEANDMIEILNKPITWTSTFRQVYTTHSHIQAVQNCLLNLMLRKLHPLITLVYSLPMRYFEKYV